MNDDLIPEDRLLQLAKAIQINTRRIDNLDTEVKRFRKVVKPGGKTCTDPIGTIMKVLRALSD